MKGISIIKDSDCKGYVGAAIYKLVFDSGDKFYIGSCHKVRKKIEKVRRNFATGKISKKFKLLIKDKTRCEFVVLERVEDISKLIERETFWIHKHLSDKRLLNRTKSKADANGTWKRTSVEKEILIQRLNRLRLLPRTPKSEEWIRLNKERMLKFNRQKDGKPINQYDRQGNLVATYSCAGVAEEATGIPYKSMHTCARYETKFVHGFIFRYVGCDQSLPVIKERRKKVKQFDSDGNFIAEYESALEASLAVGANRSNIQALCNGRGKSIAGYIFRHSSKCGNKIKPVKYHKRFSGLNANNGILSKKRSTLTK